MNIVVEIIIWIAYIISLYFSIFLLLVYLEKKEFFEHEQSGTALQEYPLISVIVPVFNEEKTVIKTLESLYHLDYPKDRLEILVVNDGSTDSTPQKIESFIKEKINFHLLSHPNRGKGASLNRGLKELKGEYFACLDADSFVEPQTLRKMLSLYEKENEPQLAVVTPAMKIYNPKNLLQKVQWFEYLVVILIARISSHMDSLYVAPGPFSVYRTSVIRKIGGFHENHLTEDQEIAYRLQEQHYKIKQCFDGYVYTNCPKKLKPFFRQRRRWYVGSLVCLKSYRKMVANRKYGDFGMMQMVKNVVGYTLAVVGIIIMVYFFLIPLYQKARTALIVQFDVLPFLNNFFTKLTLKFTFLNFLLTDFRKGFIILFLFAIGFFLFYAAHKNGNEKINKFGWIVLIPYFAFYYILKGIILLLSLMQFAQGKKIRWR